MAKSFMKFALIIVIIILLCNVVIVSKDYQDSWILEGLEISFALFMATYSLTFFSEKKVSWMVSLAIS